MLGQRLLNVMANPALSQKLHFCAAGYFFGLTLSVLYSCIFMVYPILYTEESDFILNSMFLLYVCVNILGNYYLGIYFNSSFQTGLVLKDPPASWHYCSKCSQHCPPRSHHCSICDVCVLKRDHHCFFLCQCIGLKNQKYFIVFALYVSIGSFCAIKAMLSHLHATYIPIEPTLYSLLSYIPPGILYNWLYTDANITFSTCFYFTVLYGCFSTGLGCLFLFAAQCTLVLKGQTPNEFLKHIRFQHGSCKENFLQVFGPYWLIHFIVPFPMQSKYGQPWGLPTYFKDV